MAAATTVTDRPSGVECDAHTWRFGGRHPLDRSKIHPDCLRPFRLACQSPACSSYLVMSCDAANEKVCPPCSKRYKARVQHVAEAVLNLLADGDGLFITTTPPGDSQHGPKANRCPCTPAGGVDLARWNAEQGRRVNSFRTQLRRLLARHGVEVEYFRCVEAQDGHRRSDGQGRMGLQDHWVLRVTSGRLVMTRSLERKIKKLAIRCGYGHHCKVDPIRGVGAARKVARYVSKYVSKAVTVRDQVPWKRPQGLVEVEHPSVDFETGEVDVRFDIRPVGARTYRAWTKSRSWGADMRTVRDCQRAWAQGKARTSRFEGLTEEALLSMYARTRLYGWASTALLHDPVAANGP